MVKSRRPCSWGLGTPGRKALLCSLEMIFKQDNGEMNRLLLTCAHIEVSSNLMVRKIQEVCSAALPRDISLFRARK